MLKKLNKPIRIASKNRHKPGDGEVKIKGLSRSIVAKKGAVIKQEASEEQQF